MDISAPIFQKTDRSQKIQILSTTASVKTATTVPAEVVIPDTSGTDVKAILTEFLSASSRYFSKGLSLQNFLSKANFVWNYDKFKEDINSAPAAAVVRLTWALEAVIFHQNGNYESIWQATHLVTEITIRETPAKTPAEPVAVGEDAIPFDMDANVIQPSPRRNDKQKVREAKLRAALAHLRAERLALKYYEKYGILEGTDNESTLSVDSDFEDELQDLGKI